MGRYRAPRSEDSESSSTTLSGLAGSSRWSSSSHSHWSRSITKVKSSFTFAKGSLRHDQATRCTIFVGNLPLNVTEKDIRCTFDDCGKIHAVIIRVCKGFVSPPAHGNNHGVVSHLYATVEFASREAAEASLRLRAYLGSRKLVIVRNPLRLPYSTDKMQELYAEIAEAKAGRQPTKREAHNRKSLPVNGEVKTRTFHAPTRHVPGVVTTATSANSRRQPLNSPAAIRLGLLLWERLSRIVANCLGR